MRPFTHRIAAVSAIAGAILLITGTVLHPFDADPNDPVAAFTEYAADRLWVASHLIQLAGVFLMVLALVHLSGMMVAGRGSNWARFGAVGAGTSLAAAAVLQAVDGIALKRMVDAWAAAAPAEKQVLFQAAFGVRQIEVGLAGILSLLLGTTITIYGVAIRSERSSPSWLGWLGITGGLPTAYGGIAIAYTGFSSMAMTVTMLASALALIWIVALAVWMWRLKPG